MTTLELGLENSKGAPRMSWKEGGEKTVSERRNVSTKEDLTREVNDGIFGRSYP